MTGNPHLAINYALAWTMSAAGPETLTTTAPIGEAGGIQRRCAVK